MTRRFLLALTVLVGVLLAGALLLAAPAIADTATDEAAAVVASVDLDQLVADPAPLSSALAPADATEAVASNLYSTCTQLCGQQYFDCFSNGTPLSLCEIYYCQCLRDCGLPCN